MFSRSLSRALLAGLLIAGCDTARSPAEHTDAGYAAWAAGDHDLALAELEQALAGLEPDLASGTYRRAKLGALELEALEDPEPAIQEFLVLADGSNGLITDAEFNRMIRALDRAEETEQATALLKAGLERFPDSPALRHFQLMGKPGEVDLAGLQSLGYVGQD